MTRPTRYAYISTGAKSAMFTLWTGRESGDPRIDAFLRDRFICNLAGATNEEAAETKARDYCERMTDRTGETVQFRGFYDEPQNLRRGKLSVQDTQAIERIEAGFFPFGKFAGQPITAANDGYVMYWVDQHADAKPVVAALSAACMGIAMERDLIAKREAARCARAAEDATSEFVGTIGERREFTGEIVTAFRKVDEYAGQDFYITKVRCNGNLITYIGNEIGQRGAVITFKATIKAHDVYQGVKSTKVNRPKVTA